MASKTQKAARKKVVSKYPSPQCQKGEARARRRVTCSTLIYSCIIYSSTIHRVPGRIMILIIALQIIILEIIEL